MSKGLASSVMMVRPIAFRYNEQTATNNHYQKILSQLSSIEVQRRALDEFDALVVLLRSHHIEVIVVQDTLEEDTPDSIFPNNWISFHDDGRVGWYPMYAENRRLERKKEILTLLKEQHHFFISEVVDFSHFESDGRFLEGTGSMLLDRVNKIAYAAQSLRTDARVLEGFCRSFGFRSITFKSYQTVGSERLPIYHTNVMLSLGDSFAVLCADTIDNPVEKKSLIACLEDSGKEVIFITEEQKHQFAGNVMPVVNKLGKKYLVMSRTAHQSLAPEQIQQIEKHCQILSAPLDTIEACGGGSARCMMAELFLPKNAPKK